MRRSLRTCIATLALLSIPLLGCEWKKVIVEVQDFGPDVAGVWIWRLSSETGEYQRHCRIDILDVAPGLRGETIRYIQGCLDGEPGLEMTTIVDRAPADPGSARLEIYYLRREDPGSYRISSFGALGESELSTSEVDL